MLSPPTISSLLSGANTESPDAVFGLTDMLIEIGENCLGSNVEKAFAIHWSPANQWQTQSFTHGRLHDVVINQRALIEQIVRRESTGLLLCHGHPATSSKPSKCDIRTTSNINRLCRALHVTLLDHIIFGQDSCFSFRQAGYL